jgi:hypothetical protein
VIDCRLPRHGWNGPIRDWPRYGCVDELPAEADELRARRCSKMPACAALRWITGRSAACALRISDQAENVGPDPTPRALVYHFNFGFPGIGQGTTSASDEFGAFEPLDFGRPDAESGALCRPAGGASTATSTLRVPLQNDGERTIGLSFDTANLRFVQVYRDLRVNSGLLAIEPCTSERNGAGRSSAEQTLEPGASRTFNLRLSLAGGFAAALAL